MNDWFDEGFFDSAVARCFEPRDLLNALEALDRIRAAVSDMDSSSMRSELLSLHEVAVDTYPAGSTLELIALYEAAEDLESTAFDLMEQATKLHGFLESLTDTEPKDLRTDYDL